MFNLRPTALLLAIVLAGCAAPKRKVGDPGVPDWETSESSLATKPASTVLPLPPPHASAPPPVSQSVTAATNRPGSRSETWVSLAEWSRENGLGDLRRVGGAPARFTLAVEQGVLTLVSGSRLMDWDGVQIQLGFAPMVVAGELVVHTLDLQKNLMPLLMLAQTSTSRGRVIVIDPGHGGGNTGARSVFNGIYEKDFTLDWARRLAPLLVGQGWTVFLTRTNDAEIPLPDRVAFAQEHQADIFISLHFNSAYPREEEAGLETYCLTPTGMPSNLVREFDDDVAQAFPNNAFDTQNFQLAVRLHRALLAANGDEDRGVRRARFMGVLRGQTRPAVLLEGGYLSNPKEARLIADPQHRQKLAEAVARGLEAK